MISGGKLSTKEGMQVCVLPFQDLYITQNANGNLSHQGTKNTDNASRSTRRKLYAPVDVKCMSNADNNLGLVLYHSVNKVLFADNTIDYLSMWLMHDDDNSVWEVGKIYKQGEHIYNEGKKDSSGMTTGIHVHGEFAKGHLWDRVSRLPNGRYEIINSEYIDNIFFTNLTDIVKDRDNTYGGYVGYNWREYTGGIIPPEKPNQNNILHLMLSKALPNFL